MWTATADGNVADLTAAKKDEITAGIATAAGVEPKYVSAQFLPGSIKIMAIIVVPQGTDVSTIQTSVADKLGSKSGASTVTGLTISTVPTVASTTVSDASAQVQSEGGTAFVNAVVNTYNQAVAMATGILVAIIVGPTVAALCIIGLVVYCCCCRKKKAMHAKVVGAA